MEVIEIKDRTDLLIRELTCIWEKSVKATHLFLSLEEINNNPLRNENKEKGA